MMPTPLLRVRLPPSEPITRSGPLNRFSASMPSLYRSIKAQAGAHYSAAEPQEGQNGAPPQVDSHAGYRTGSPQDVSMILPPAPIRTEGRPPVRHRNPVMAKRTLSLSEYRLQPLIYTSPMNGSCEEPPLPVRYYGVQSKNREVGKILRRPFGDHVTNTKRGGDLPRGAKLRGSGVPGEGVEPSWTEVRGILSPVRLPVSPPRRHVLLPHLGKSVERLAGEWRTGTLG